jgi:putative SOS response-associated peptidase YedK
MCGRYSSDLRWEDIAKLYDLAMQGPPHWNFPPSYNVCPTDPVSVNRPNADGREFVRMRWGLIPRWWSKPLKEMRVATFNARAETVQEKPFFRDAFKRNRCLMPISGYYEWQNTADGKQPYYFTRRDGQPMTIAALWDTWHDKSEDRKIESCAMVITEPNKFVGHPRPHARHPRARALRHMDADGRSAGSGRADEACRGGCAAEAAGVQAREQFKGADR